MSKNPVAVSATLKYLNVTVIYCEVVLTMGFISTEDIILC